MARWLHHLLGLALVLVLGLAGAASAQLSDTQSEYYKRWLSTAERAEKVIAAQRASNVALEKLRSELNTYRENFNKARTANSERLTTLEAQLKALGPAPDDGSEEPEELAQLRAHLENQINKLKLPRIISEEAFSRANGLIGEIDSIIRARQRKELLARGPSPLNPAYWLPAWEAVSEAARSLVNETEANLRSAVVRERMSNDAPAILTLVVLALVLLIFGRRWSEKAGDYLRRFGGSGRGVWSFIVSLFRIIFPWVGVVLLIQAVTMTGVLGLRGTLLMQEVPYWAAIILFYDWIGRQVYLMSETGEAIALSGGKVAELRLYVDLLAVMLILHELVLLFGRIENISDATRAVVSFPAILITGLLLLRVRQIRGGDTGETDDQAAVRGRAFAQIVELLRRLMFLLGAAGPVLAAMGYTNAAEAVVFPAVKTLILIAALVIFQRFVTSLYGWLTGQQDRAGDSLFSVLVGFVLAILSLPVLALYWGARETDLIEAWSRIMLGFDIGGVTISPSNFLTFVAVFVIGYMLTRLLQSTLRGSLLPKTGLDAGGQAAVVAGTGYVGIFVAALVAIVVAGFDLSSLAIVAGALSVGIGFGLQTIVSNFVSGIILLIERPISQGDWIDVNGMTGYVRDISVRSTRIETFDRTDVIIPNSDLISGVVTNYTRGNTIGRVIVPVGVAYGTDTAKVEKILREVANQHPMVLAHPAPNIYFAGFGADSLDFEIRAIIRDVNWVVSVKSDMNHEINRRFAEEGIEIPFAQRDVWLRNPETLRNP
ncbi:Small-conductance mechanosensitive channel [Ruegeria intermedia]|uniref:Small-conductance mechanosensitive channel n=1 Tax=Ruegeria intermedia TaxID=996115 RepID=A0A1M5BLC6_9RHOB|nr:DUF3772 domain-containing protein [Ruegeria intermedia]SHF43205.1 Small-conductance mechanosensitive channel [Ruegeria intermedia]